MNAEQRHQTAADRRLRNYIHRRHLLLLSPEADTHSTIPETVEGRVQLNGWLHTQTIYCPQAVTHPSSNRAQCRLNTLIKANALTTILRRLYIQANSASYPQRDGDEYGTLRSDSLAWQLLRWYVSKCTARRSSCSLVGAKRVCDFILVCNSNLRPILHCFEILQV